MINAEYINGIERRCDERGYSYTPLTSNQKERFGELKERLKEDGYSVFEVPRANMSIVGGKSLSKDDIIELIKRDFLKTDREEKVDTEFSGN